MRTTFAGAGCLLPRWWWPRPLWAWVTLLIAGWCGVVREDAAKAAASDFTSHPPKNSLEFSATPTVEEIFRAHVFEEPLVTVGGPPTASENAALASALIGYSKRQGPDDFSSLTGFLTQNPKSPWAAALMTDLGLEYYHTAHYSLALDAWSKAWALAKDATEARARCLADRAFGELIYMNARLGRMDQIHGLLKASEARPLLGAAKGRADDARAALWTMQNRPEIAFRCGPLALRSVRLALGGDASADVEIYKSASTQQGFSLPQVAELSRKIGLNFQLAFRNPGADFVVPAVVHWKVGHYAALVRKVGDLCELQDPTFGNSTWATGEALEAETSGYFLVPPGKLSAGWRKVDEKEGGTVWGKGQTASNDPQHCGKNDYHTPGCPPLGPGMAVASIFLMDVGLNLSDEPVGYTPPVGPEVRLFVRYNQRDIFQPANFNYVNFGPQFTCDWIAYITDTPSNVLADVNEYLPGGGQRTFTGFNTNTQTFAFQQYDRTLLKRTGPNSYELLSGDGSKLVFDRPDGSIGSTRNVFMTQMVDPQGNAVTLTYDADLRLIAVTDAIGEVTTLSYGFPDDTYKVTRVTDPFGRFASFAYNKYPVDWQFTILNNCPDPSVVARPTLETWLETITDVIGLSSQFTYQSIPNAMGACAQCPANQVVNCVSETVFTDSIVALSTPYGTTQFDGRDFGNTRYSKITHPDGGSEIVQYDQTNNIPQSEPAATVPIGMTTYNSFLPYRNTFHWDRSAATSYPDHSKARLFHWLHAESGASTSGALESLRQPLENRVWLDYTGQAGTFASLFISSNTLPAHIGRVLDDGSTQLYSYEYNGFGHVTKSIDPVGRTFSYIYDTNEIDVLEVRQTRGTNNELLVKATYNAQHRPLTITDAAGQTTTISYNTRGQVLAATNAKHETVTFTYDSNGYLVTIDGALPGTNDLVTTTYDTAGRVLTTTTVSGYTVAFEYDNLDRVTRVTYPDGTFSAFTYERLDLAVFKDRAGRQTFFEHDSMRRLVKQTDPLSRATSFEWCRCGQLKSITDPMGRTTSWLTDVQDRKIAKQYCDGSQVRYFYENSTSRLRQILDEKQQSTFYSYNVDDTLRSVAYANAVVPTPDVSFTYDGNYQRVASMTDGTGRTTYTYYPVTVPPALGAGHLANVDGALPNDAIAYGYDELGRAVRLSVNGVTAATTLDAAGRPIGETNALGVFVYNYVGAADRVASRTFPNGETAAMSYAGATNDFALQQLAYTVGSTPISHFSYDHDVPRHHITTWSQQAGSQPASVFTLSYDEVDQLLSATVTNLGVQVNSFAYTYDPVGNRLSEQIGANSSVASYNALNQISTTSTTGGLRTNEWDAAHRLAAVNAGNQRTEFTYDGNGRRVAIRQLVNGTQVSRRQFVWCGFTPREERDASGAVTKRYFGQGMKVESGPNAGKYFYTADHLGSVRELTDSSGAVRARYSYDPWGRRTRVAGDLDTDFGFAGMFWSPEANLSLTAFRAYDPEMGRWLSRDPLQNAELNQGPNLYAYAGNNPVNLIDPLGLLLIGSYWTDQEWERYYELSGHRGEVRDVYEGEMVESSQGEMVEAETTPPADYWELKSYAYPEGGQVQDVEEGQVMEAEEGAVMEAEEGGAVVEAEELDAGLEEYMQEAMREAIARQNAQTTEALVESETEFSSAVRPRAFPGFGAAASQVIGAGITILTMTDCNTAEGIFALVRQGKGGMANKYADRLMKQISPYLQ